MPSGAVMLNFWARWCEPCRAEMPTLQQLVDFYGDRQLVVLAINFKESRMTAAGFAKRTGMTLPVVLDAEGAQGRYDSYAPDDFKYQITAKEIV